MGRIKVKRTDQLILTCLIGVTALLFAMAPTAQARKLYTANLSVGTVSSVEVEDGVAISDVTHVPIVDGSPRPYSVAVNPEGTRVYATVIDAVNGTIPDSVYVINTEDNSTTRIEVGDQPRSIAIAPNGEKAYVTNTGTKTLSVIDTSDNSVTTALEGQLTGVGEVAVHPDGSRVYVADTAGQKILVLDASTDTVEDTIDLPMSDLGNPTRPMDIGFTPDGDTMIVTYTTDKQPANWYYGGAWYIGADRDGANYHQVERTLSTGDRVYSSYVVVTPDGSRSYIANTRAASDRIYALDNSSRELIGDPIEPGNNALINGPYYLAMSPRGAFAVTGNASTIANFASVIDTDPASETYNSVLAPIMIPHPNPDTPTLPTRPIGVAFTPNQSPVGALSVDTEPVGDISDLDASASFDPDGTIAKYHWQFGDGDIATTTSPVAEHVYTSPGSYTASVTVEDNEGSKGELVFTGKTAMHAAGPAKASSTFDVETIDEVSAGPASEQSTPSSGSEDNPQGKSSTRPKLKVLYPRKGASYRKKKLRSFKGTAKGGNKIKVRYSLAIKAGKKCRLLTAKGKARQHKLGSCRSSAFKRTKGSNRWSVKLGSSLRPGKYILTVKATNAEGRGSVKRVEFSVV